MNVKQQVLLIILDGLGAAAKGPGNAVVLAEPKNLSNYWSIYPHTYLLASGEVVGLPKNVKGNSEVGHLNLGSGNTVFQNLPRINKAIESGLIYKNNTLREAYEHALKYKSKIHLLGLLSDGSSHSHIDHFKVILNYFAKLNLPNDVFLHCFTDGRDTSPSSSLKYLNDIDRYCLDLGIGKIGTVVGRYFAMDRNKKWDRTQKTYYMLERGMGERYPTYQKIVEEHYAKGITDEFFEPSILNDSKVEKNDVVIFLNFRPDRALQLSEAIAGEDFNAFSREPIENLFFASMTEYRKGFPKNVVFPKQYIKLPLGKIIDSHGSRQLRIAETEKFPHVTYFFNGGVPTASPKEDRIVIPSPKVATYDLKPEMSSLEITSTLINRIKSRTYDFILVNFANPDMVGHTGDIEAGIKAVKVVDYCVYELVKNFLAIGGAVLITADHGNAEEMLNPETNEMQTEHSLNPVPLIIAGTDIKTRTLPYGSLKDVAPTVLDIMGISKPADMGSKSLIKIL